MYRNKPHHKSKPSGGRGRGGSRGRGRGGGRGGRGGKSVTGANSISLEAFARKGNRYVDDKREKERIRMLNLKRTYARMRAREDREKDGSVEGGDMDMDLDMKPARVVGGKEVDDGFGTRDEIFEMVKRRKTKVKGEDEALDQHESRDREASDGDEGKAHVEVKITTESSGGRAKFHRRQSHKPDPFADARKEWLERKKKADEEKQRVKDEKEARQSAVANRRKKVKKDRNLLLRRTSKGKLENEK